MATSSKTNQRLNSDITYLKEASMKTKEEIQAEAVERDRRALKNIVRGLATHDSDCISRYGFACDCGAEEFKKPKWQVR